MEGQVVQDPANVFAPPRTAYTPQVPQLFSETLADNILPGVDGDLDQAIALAVLEDDVAEMADGLASRIGSRGLRLSGGQMQRTAAARMFVRRPDLLVCDDLSSALDVETEARLWERVFAQADRTVLAVSHRRAALRRADQVVLMRDGRVTTSAPWRSYSSATTRWDGCGGSRKSSRRAWLMAEHAHAARELSHATHAMGAQKFQ